jgi:hypothetical protein
MLITRRRPDLHCAANFGTLSHGLRHHGMSDSVAAGCRYCLAVGLHTRQAFALVTDIGIAMAGRCLWGYRQNSRELTPSAKPPDGQWWGVLIRLQPTP